MKILSFITIFAATTVGAVAQDFPFGKPTSAEFEMKRYEKDISANAVVLREYGTAWVSSTDVNVMFEYHVRIKIFNSKGFKQGNIEIPLIKSDANTFEKISDIKGLTFYPDQDGLMRSAELDSKQIFTEKKAGKYNDIKKFAMPGLKDGCIIEYAYTIESPYRFNFRNWQFQSDIPKIYSEFSPQIPAIYNYNVTLVGPYKLSKTNSELVKECFTPGGGFKADCSKMTYAMEHVPAFVEEEYMTSANNFKAAINFELSDYTDPYGVKHQVTKEWKDVDRELKTDDSFGVQLKKKDFFKDKLVPVLAGKTNEIDKAKAIYNYIKGWYKWNNYYGRYSDDGLKKSFENRSGNSGDINLALVTALNAAGLNAEPVILSTRDNGMVNPLFPILSDFNYVICRATVGQESFMLDATDPLLPFGMLPLRCINDKGRIMNFSKGSEWVEMKASQKESKSINLDLSIDETGKIKGNVVVSSGGYEALSKRKSIRKFNSVEEYIEDLDERMPKMKILKSDIANLDSLEKSVVESYEIEINSTEKDVCYLNTFFLDRIKENPFKLAERTYPVDISVASDTRILVQLRFPQKFELISKPQDLGLALPNGGGRLVNKVSVEGNTLTMLFNLQFAKPVYSSEEYSYLKELYNKIISTQNTDIILKKKI